MTTEVYGIYAHEYDITFVMEEKFTDDGEPYSLEVKGFYYGRPDEQANKVFYGDLIAHFCEKEPLTVKKLLKRVVNWLLFLFIARGPVANKGVNDGLIDYSGQGHDDNKE